MAVSHPSGDARTLKQEAIGTSASGVNVSSTSILSGASEILGLLGFLGKVTDFLVYRGVKDTLDVYNKFPYKHYHTGWVLSQVRI